MAKNPLKHTGADGKTRMYDLDVRDLQRITGHSDRWVYNHWPRFGGIKRVWGPGAKETIRFPSVGLARLMANAGQIPQSEIAPADTPG